KVLWKLIVQAAHSQSFDQSVLGRFHLCMINNRSKGCSTVLTPSPPYIVKQLHAERRSNSGTLRLSCSSSTWRHCFHEAPLLLREIGQRSARHFIKQFARSIGPLDRANSLFTRKAARSNVQPRRALRPVFVRRLERVK